MANFLIFIFTLASIETGRDFCGLEEGVGKAVTINGLFLQVHAGFNLATFHFITDAYRGYGILN